MLFTQPAVSDERKAFYQRIDRHNLTPLWEVLGALVPRSRKRRVSLRSGATMWRVRF